MKQDLLCTWLGLDKTAWPPEPRTLLGLRPDEHDPAFIEKRVHDRMAKLRSYQLSYPEEATEGMNRLAEAFITLTEASKAQDPAILVTTVANTKPANGPTVTADWRASPPPVREVASDTPEPIAEQGADDIVVSLPFVAPPRPIRRGISPELLRELAEESADATSNLATLEAVIERVERTRVLLHAWDKLAKPLKGTGKKITPKDNDAYAARLDRIAQALQGYPAFLGPPGKPGYRVVVQAKLNITLTMVRGLHEEQREELLLDWEAGRQVLLAHRKYLHRLFQSMRRRSTVGLFWHAVRALVNDYPLWTLAGVLVLVVVIGGILAALK